MNRKRLLTIFGIIYVVSLGFFMKNYTDQAVSDTNLTALCLEASLPCMDVIAVEQKTETKQAHSPQDSRAPPPTPTLTH